MRFLVVLVFMVGCGTSPEFIDEPEWPAAAQDEASDSDATVAAEEAPRPEDNGLCAGETGATRLKGRLGRQVGVEGFTSRSCPRQTAP
jgi:hypothetical protein